jgi:LacI family transcriptional regulator
VTSASSIDVATAAGVSQSTVSRVINGRTNVRAATRAAVERAMIELQYVPNAAARSLITKRTRLLGLVVSNITNGFYPEIIEAITASALQAGYTMIVGSAGERSSSQAAYLRLLAEQRVDGAVLTSTLLGGADDIEALTRGGLPIVLVNRVRDDLGLDGVSLNNYEAGRVATAHLLDHGRRRIVYVGGRPDASTNAGRFAGYCRAHQDARVELDGSLVDHGEFTRQYGYDRVSELISRQARFDGMVAADDTVALGCLDALLEAGRRVPDDVGLIGFDDIPAASLRGVWLTTVSSSAVEMGRRAVGLLLERLRDQFEGPPRSVVLPPQLIVRGSCGPHEPRGGHKAQDRAALN